MDKSEVAKIQKNLAEQVATLQDQIKKFKLEIQLCENAIAGFESDIMNHWYDDHDEAKDTLMEIYWEIANEACSGTHSMGADTYTQRYKIYGDPDTYEATIKFEYNRHDKMYYYIDGKKFSYSKVI